MTDFLRRLLSLSIPMLAPAGEGDGGGGGGEGNANSGQASARDDRAGDKPGPSVRDALRAAIAERDGEGGDDDDGEGGDDAKPDAGEDDGDGTDKPGLPKRGKGGKFTPRDKAPGAEDGDGGKDASGADKPGDGEEGDGDNADADQAGADQLAADQDADKVANPPASWKPEHRANWQKLPPETRAYIHEREAEAAQGFAQFKAKAEPRMVVADKVYEILQPYSQDLAARGVHPLDLIKNTLRDAYLIDRGTPAEKMTAFRDLAQRMGFTVEGDMALPGTDATSGAIPPAVMSELQALREQVQAVKGGQDAAITAAVKEQADRFENATDDKGAKLHPHYPKVRATMGDLLRSGMAADLNEAYAKACKLVPEVEAAIVAEREAKKLAAQRQKEKDRVAKARGANGSVNGKPGGLNKGGGGNGADADGSNLRSTLRDAVRASRGGGGARV